MRTLPAKWQIIPLLALQLQTVWLILFAGFLLLALIATLVVQAPMVFHSSLLFHLLYGLPVHLADGGGPNSPCTGAPGHC